MKAIPSSSKERKRFILVRFATDLKVEKTDIERLVIQAGLQFLGELGMARAGLQVLGETWNAEKQTVIVRVGHKFVDETKAALALVKEYNGKPIKISAIKVSGTIEKVKNDNNN